MVTLFAQKLLLQVIDTLRILLTLVLDLLGHSHPVFHQFQPSLGSVDNSLLTQVVALSSQLLHSDPLLPLECLHLARNPFSFLPGLLLHELSVLALLLEPASSLGSHGVHPHLFLPLLDQLLRFFQLLQGSPVVGQVLLSVTGTKIEVSLFVPTHAINNTKS